MRNFFIVVACAIVAAMSLQARGATVMLEANLDGFQEVPTPHNTPGFGSVDVNLDTITGAVSVTSGSYQDLLGNSFSVSLSGPAAVGVSGSKISALTLDSPGTTTGTISGSGTLASNINDILSGNTYINVFSSVFPGGEIRGQLIATPEPATLMTFAVAGGLLLRRRRI